MFDWFEKIAPIREKFNTLIAFYSAIASLNLLAGLAAYLSWISPLVAMCVIAVTNLILVASITLAKRLICDPYVNTVLRMEALADGDTTSPFSYSDHRDCVGRMTVAMETFRAALVANRETEEAQKIVLDEFTTALNELAQGNLTHRVNNKVSGEHAPLRDAYNGSIERLAESFSKVSESTNSVGSGSNEIRAASDDLAIRNEQQAASLEETAASMSQVTQLVKKSAESAKGAQRAMTATYAEAEKGGKVVQKAVDAMAEIEKSSSEITQIIDVIDGIAFQTNLLALNAGVEAARAGEAGKGFAVVANEVRALAQRSAEAASDIKQLISNSTSHVGNGVHLVGETGDLLQTIVNQIGGVNGEVNEIATMASAQANNLEQVNISVGEMDQMTQQNAAMVEQSTAASRNLAEQANLLGQLVDHFKFSRSANSHSLYQPSPQSGPAPEPARAASKLAPRPAAAAPKRAPAGGNLALATDFEDQDWSEF